MVVNDLSILMILFHQSTINIVVIAILFQALMVFNYFSSFSSLDKNTGGY